MTPLSQKLATRTIVPATGEIVSNKTISPRRLRQLRADDHNLETPWEDVVALAVSLREERDRATWQLGDLCLAACLPVVGRPRDGEASRTISALANAIGEDRAVLSNLRSNSEFYDEGMRLRIPPQVSWRQASEARRRSGWRPDSPILPEHRERAMRFILRFEEDMDDPPAPPSVAEEVARTVGRLEALKFENEAAGAMLADALATAKKAAYIESGAGEPEGLTDPEPEEVFPLWPLSGETAWTYLARLTDDERRANVGIVILEGPGWTTYNKVRVKGMH